MMDRKYTVSEFCCAANGLDAEPEDRVACIGPINDPSKHYAMVFRNHHIAEMLRQAAYMLDGISKEIERIDSMQSAPLDGAPYHQEINGLRLKARIEFFDSVKKIILHEKNEVKR